MWNGEVEVITGIRRCGKSVLLFDLFYEHLLGQGVAEEQITKIELNQRRYYKIAESKQDSFSGLSCFYEPA